MQRCLSLLDAGNLETALHRFGQFFHIVLDDFRIESRRDGPIAQLTLYPNPAFHRIGPLGHELMLKLAQGVGSWLIGQHIPLLQVDLACPQPVHALDRHVPPPRVALFRSSLSSTWQGRRAPGLHTRFCRICQ